MNGAMARVYRRRYEASWTCPRARRGRRSAGQIRSKDDRGQDQGDKSGGDELGPPSGERRPEAMGAEQGPERFEEHQPCRRGDTERPGDDHTARRRVVVGRGVPGDRRHV